jgi:hypothetical protein
MTFGAPRGSARPARTAALALGASLVIAACGSVTLSPDGGSSGRGGSSGASGAAGEPDAGGAGTAGASGSTGAAGVTGTAGKGGADGGVACGPVCQIYCQYGNVLDANGCPTCACNPAPSVCPTDECPASPPFAEPTCGSAPIIAAACLRGTDGTCAWHAPSCGMCPAINCPNLTCANGYVSDSGGCATCACNTCPSGTHPVACSGVTCNIACPYGFARDADGCSVCSCRAAPTCDPGADCIICPFGYRQATCHTCDCEAPPPGCAANPVQTDPTP